MPRDDAILLDIARAARLAMEFVQDADEHALATDLKLQSAVLHQLLVLGEAVKRLSPEFREKHQQMPWTLIAGMRDKLIHDYNEVDLRLVWKTLKHDIPALAQRIEPLLPKSEE